MLKQFINLANEIGNRVDYVQGGGGNISAKLDDNKMVIKASGYKFSQITKNNGFAVLDYNNVRKFYNEINPCEDKDYEQIGSAFVSENIIELENIKKLRPSVEAGFHSILDTFVIHTHSVYANVLTCAVDGNKLIEKCFANKDYGVLFIEFTNPGFWLTYRILQARNEYTEKHGKKPTVIFMENHGVIVTDDNAEKCMALHEDVNSTIIKFYSLPHFPEMKLIETDGKIFSDTEYLKSYFLKKVPTTLFDDYILYPDQLVYLNGDSVIGSSKDDKKLHINYGNLEYNCTYAQAQNIEENLLAYIYVIDCIEEIGYKVQNMPQSGIDFIANWESEKYRKSLSK